MRVAISDTHTGGLDLQRKCVDMLGNMTTGMELLVAFINWAIEERHYVYGLGDIVDFVDKYPEAVRECWAFFRCKPDVYIGNHDRRMINVPPWYGPMNDLAKLDELVVCVLEPGVIESPEQHYRLRARHGHQLDDFWGDPTRREERWGERIIKHGRYLQQHIHPKADEWLLRGGKRLLHALIPVLPKGARIDDRAWVDKVIADMPPSIDVEVDGHTHRRLWVRKNGKEVVNLGSWVPRKHPTEKGELLMPGIWLFEERRLIGWTMDGTQDLEREEW